MFRSLYSHDARSIGSCATIPNFLDVLSVGNSRRSKWIFTIHSSYPFFHGKWPFGNMSVLIRRTQRNFYSAGPLDKTNVVGILCTNYVWSFSIPLI